MSDHGLIEIYCGSLFNVFNNFYEIRDIEFWDPKGEWDSYGLGLLRQEMIKSASHNHRLAFLCGAFYRYGWNSRPWPTSWQYSLMTSENKVELITDLLIDIGCDVEITYEHDITCGGVRIKFIPTQEFKDWVKVFEEGS